MIEGIFEVAMLLCFAAAWPFSIYKSYTSRTAKGKSLFFLLVLIMGYIFGIANKIVSDQVNYVLVFYIMDMCLVLIDASLYLRNMRLDKARELDLILHG
jgi:hypothetical protein